MNMDMEQNAKINKYLFLLMEKENSRKH